MKKRPQDEQGGHVRSLFRRLVRPRVLLVAWLTVTVASTGAVVATGESPFAASEAVSGPAVFAGRPGVSNALHATTGIEQVGALFNGGLSGGHYCTAGVVRSTNRNIIVTAAHCLTRGPGHTVFVPGYHDGRAPYGVWPLKSVTLAPGWKSHADPDLDVAFAEVAPLHGRRIQDVVGGYRMGTGGGAKNDGRAATTVRLIGYPSVSNAPLSCYGNATAYTARQLRIACNGYTGGTSGGPWITGQDPDTGGGTVIGVIGGYEEGGRTPDISYSAAFDRTIRSLYDQAVATSG